MIKYQRLQQSGQWTVSKLRDFLKKAENKPIHSVDISQYQRSVKIRQHDLEKLVYLWQNSCLNKKKVKMLYLLKF